MSRREDRLKLHLRKVSNNQQQNVVSFRSHSDCDGYELQESYKTVVSKILWCRDIIVVTKGARLMELISDAVDANIYNYVAENSREISTFILESASFKTYATLLKKVPLGVAEDLASSSEFVFGNLWFIIPSDDEDVDQCSEQVVNDSRLLAPSAFDEPPVLSHEAVASPAMYDGLEILWFKPDNYVYENMIRPLFEHE